MAQIFDTHAHYTSHRFNNHRTEILNGLPKGNVGAVMECACDYTSTVQALQLAQQFPFLYVAGGIHPQSIVEEDASTVKIYNGNWEAELNDIAPLLAHPKVKAVGEIGLDYYWKIPKEEQNKLFLAQLALAHEHNLPALIHDREAHADMYEVLKKYKPKGVLHCYSGSADDAQWITQQGIYIGVGGTVTFKNAKHIVQTVQNIPLEKIVLETDCPYLAPEPYRGKENNSTYIVHIAQCIAQIKQTTLENVLQTTWSNACELFAITL